ncbi:putative membrane protein [Caldibacillus thermoamylovorans]|uniref:Putative membrane protein n=1 Tax=Caldibacillus thermoamylovorans TaxID=35841 RepID=A0A090J2U2_9BACI|nr:putative membrane protein [Caldibacillus thermoamylovorans]
MIYFIKAEIMKIKNNLLIWIILSILFLFMIYIIFDPFPYINLKIPTYFSSVYLLSFNVIGSILYIVVGALLGYKEYSWNTFHMLVNSNSRIKIFYYKSITIFIISFVLSVIACIFGILIHMFLGSSGQLISFQLFTQVITISIIGFLWGEVAFILSLITRNLLLSIVALFLISFFEPIIYQYFPQGILKFFFVYNQKGILNMQFSNLVEGSYLIITPSQYPDLPWSISYPHWKGTA